MAEGNHRTLEGVLSEQYRDSKYGVWLVNEQNTEQDVRSVYNDTAEIYEDMSNKLGYICHTRGTDIFMEHLKMLKIGKDSKIADVGCGTGLCGEILHQNGYTNLTAVDISEQMLQESKKKNAYENFIQKDLNKDSIKDLEGTFDAAIGIGLFYVGQANADAVEKTLRMIRKGGILCFTLRSHVYNDEKSGFKLKFDSLVKEGKWEKIFSEDSVFYENLDANGYYFVFKSCI